MEVIRMRAGRILLKAGAVALIIIVTILGGITFVLSKAAGWIFGPVILFVIGCIVFCVFKQEWSQCLPLAIILAGSVGMLIGAGALLGVLDIARHNLAGFIIS